MPLTPEEYYKQEFLRFEEGIQKQASVLDNTTFWVSTGTLVLSVNFIANLKDKVFVAPGVLVAGWIFLLLTIIFQSIALKMSVTFHQRVVEELNTWSNNRFEPTPFEWSERTKKKRKRSERVNNLVMPLLVIGLVLVTYFVVINFLIV